TLLEQSKEGGGMEKGKGQGRSFLARKLLVRGRVSDFQAVFFLGGCSPLDLANTAPYKNFDSPGQRAGGVLILCDNTPERVALLGGQLCDNTPEKAALSCNMLWSQRPYEVVMSFTRSKPGLRAVRKIGHNLSGTTHLTLPL
ncbi:hypothetical protein CFP56_036581, partial [Quercus suber]